MKDPYWSGRSYAPKCKGTCGKCGSKTLHHEGDTHYCTQCDDFVARPPVCEFRGYVDPDGKVRKNPSDDVKVAIVRGIYKVMIPGYAPKFVKPRSGRATQKGAIAAAKWAVSQCKGRRRKNSDEEARRLARSASLGDPMAHLRLQAAAKRVGPPGSWALDLPIKDFVKPADYDKLATAQPIIVERVDSYPKHLRVVGPGFSPRSGRLTGRGSYWGVFSLEGKDRGRFRVWAKGNVIKRLAPLIEHALKSERPLGSYVTKGGYRGRVKAVKNLGWLLAAARQAADIRARGMGGLSQDIRLIKVGPGRGDNDAFLTVVFGDGKLYETDFADRGILWKFLDRPSFHGVQRIWFGKEMQVSRKQPYWTGKEGGLITRRANPRRSNISDADWHALSVKELGYRIRGKTVTSITRIPLQGDYDRNGRYWGAGLPLWNVSYEEGDSLGSLMDAQLRSPTKRQAQLDVVTAGGVFAGRRRNPGPIHRARPQRMPALNVEWTKLTPGTPVTLQGKPGTRYYVAHLPGGKALVNWGSRDARQAQAWLDRQVAVTMRSRRSNPRGKVLGWSVAKTRFGDERGIYHLVIEQGAQGVTTACGTKTMLSGQVEKVVPSNACRRCLERKANPLNRDEAATSSRVLQTAAGAGFAPQYFKGYGAAMSVMEGGLARQQEGRAIGLGQEAWARSRRSNPMLAAESWHGKGTPLLIETDSQDRVQHAALGFGPAPKVYGPSGPRPLAPKRNPEGCKRCKGSSKVTLGRNVIPCPMCCRKAKNPLNEREISDIARSAAGMTRRAKKFARSGDFGHAADFNARAFGKLMTGVIHQDPSNSRASQRRIGLMADAVAHRAGAVLAADAASRAAPEVAREMYDSQTKFERGARGKAAGRKRNPLDSHKPGCQCIFHSGKMGRKKS